MLFLWYSFPYINNNNKGEEMKTYKTYSPPGSTQTTTETKTFNLEVIWDWEEGSLIRCNIPKEVMKWDWIEAADFFSDLQGWAKTQVDAVYHQLNKADQPFKQKHIPTLKKLKVNDKGWGQEGQE